MPTPFSWMHQKPWQWSQLLQQYGALAVTAYRQYVFRVLLFLSLVVSNRTDRSGLMIARTNVQLVAPTPQESTPASLSWTRAARASTSIRQSIYA